MKLLDPLPDIYDEMLKPLLTDEEEILYCQKSDLTCSRHFSDTYFVATGKAVYVLDQERSPLVLSLEAIKDVRCDELFGSGRLVADTKNGDVPLIFYSKLYVPEFAVFASVINSLANDKEPLLPEEHQRAVCANCGEPLPERGANCPLCLSRFKILTRLLSILSPYKKRVALLMTVTFVTVACQMIPPYLTKVIIDDVCETGDIEKLPLWIGLMLLCGLFFLFARLIGGGLTAWLGARIVANLRSRLHETLQRLRMQYFDGRGSGQLVSRVMYDTGELQHFLIDGSSYFFVQSLSFVAIACVLLYLDVRLALMVFLPVPFLLGGGKWFWQRLIPLFHKHGSKMGALHSVLNESIRGLKAVKAYSGESRRINEFDKTNEGMFGLLYKLEHTFVSFEAGMFWIMSIGIAGVWYFGARRLALNAPGETLTTGTLLAFVGYIWLFYGPLQWFTAILNWMTHAFSGAERIFAVLDSKEEVYDAPDAIDLTDIKGDVSFNDVRFSYERGKEVIKGISFDIKAGEMVGLVGKSGVGKSTIINLICRFYDVDAGQITIDGHSIGKLNLEQLRSQIGMVMQDPFLFDASIAENIGYGVKNAEFADIVKAAKAAKAHDFIINKEDGYDSIVGESGIKLSGGEKQRLAIARAILHDPPILILDEATSSVDTETEQQIQEAMAHLIKGRTVIGIAHRLSTLRNANRLIVIDDGKVVEVGSHDELVSSDGIYARLVTMQSSLNEIKGQTW